MLNFIVRFIWLACSNFSTYASYMYFIFPTASSYGNNFYIGFMPNAGGSLSSIKLTIATLSTSTVTCIYEDITGLGDTVLITANSPVTVDLPSSLIVSDRTFANRQKGLHVYTPNEEEIFIIVESIFHTFSHGVFLAYPYQQVEETLSTYEYSTISASSHTTTHDSQILIVGRENNTMIAIAPSQEIILPEDLQSISSGLRQVQAGNTIEDLVIHEMQTLLINSVDDLTGTRIISNKPLTVISGHECASVPSSFAGCEPFAVQVPLTVTWGSSFLLPPFVARTSGTVHRILTSEKATSLSYVCGNSSLQVAIAPESYFEFTSTEYCSLRTSNRVLVVQQASSGEIDSVEDPAASNRPCAASPVM